MLAGDCPLAVVVDPRLADAHGYVLPVADQVELGQRCAGVDHELLVVLGGHWHTTAVLVVVDDQRLG